MRKVAQYRRKRIDPALDRKTDVHERDIRLMATKFRNGLDRVARLGHDDHIGLAADDEAQSFAKDRMIVHGEQSNLSPVRHAFTQLCAKTTPVREAVESSQHTLAWHQVMACLYITIVRRLEFTSGFGTKVTMRDGQTAAIERRVGSSRTSRPQQEIQCKIDAEEMGARHRAQRVVAWLAPIESVSEQRVRG